MNRGKSMVSATFAFLALSLASSSWAEAGPRETVETANQQIQALLSKQAPQGSPAAIRRDEELRQVVSTLLDIDRMAEQALGRYWRERSASERQEYLTLMRQLVERSYLRQARSRTQYQVHFGAVDVSGEQAEVITNLNFATRGRQESIEVVYSLERREGRWRVTDIETEGSSTVMGYRGNFRRIIAEHGFTELINRMRGRLEAGEADL